MSRGLGFVVCGLWFVVCGLWKSTTTDNKLQTKDFHPCLNLPT